MGMFDENFVPIADVLDWEQALRPRTTHWVAYHQLVELRIKAKGKQRKLTSFPFSLAPSWPEIDVDVDLARYYPQLDKHGRATGTLYLVEGGPNALLAVEDVVVNAAPLATDRWRLSPESPVSEAKATSDQRPPSATKRTRRRNEVRPDIAGAVEALEKTSAWNAQDKERCRLVEKHLGWAKGACSVTTLRRAIKDRSE